MALRVSRTARRRYGLDDLLPAGGRLPAPELPTLRRVADRINRARALDESVQPLSGGALLAASVIEDRLVEDLRQREGRLPGSRWEALLAGLRRRAGAGQVEAALARWQAEFAAPGDVLPPAQQLRELVTLWLLDGNEAVRGIIAPLTEGAPRATELW
ncbi:MAG: hypothetical protein ACRD0X_03170, partial [Thermoanaerobaculia bacterium]